MIQLIKLIIQEISLFCASILNVLIQYNSHHRQQMLKTYCQPIQSSSFMTQKAFLRTLKERDATIAEQKSIISQLEERIQKTVKNAKNMRESKLYHCFMEKYEDQYKLRTQMERDVGNRSALMADKLRELEQMANKRLSEELDLSETQDERSELWSTNSSQISEIMRPEGCNSSILNLGQVTRVNPDSAMIQLQTRVELFSTVIQILVNKYEKHLLEYTNMQTMIKMERRKVEQQLKKCQDELKLQKTKFQQFSKQHKACENQKLKWRDIFKGLQSENGADCLSHYSRDELVNQVMRLMGCVKKLDKKREQQIREFKIQEKKRYEVFLQNIRSNKK